MMEIEACRVLPGQMVQTISVDVGDAAAVEKAMGEAVAKQGSVQVRSSLWSIYTHTYMYLRFFAAFWIVDDTHKSSQDTYIHALFPSLSVGQHPTSIDSGLLRVLHETSVPPSRHTEANLCSLPGSVGL